MTKVLKLAREKVPFYQGEEYDILDEVDRVTPEVLRSLPCISKHDLNSSEGSIINSDYKEDELLINLTSGTSGEPLKVYHTTESFSVQWAIWGRHKERFGVEQVGSKFLTFGARAPVPIMQDEPPFWRRNYAMNQTYLSTFHLSPEFLPEIIEFLQNEEFAYFTGYPSSMYTVAAFMLSKDITLAKPPKVIFTGSDALSKSRQFAIEKAFGAPVTEQYGMAEACGNFSKCEVGNFHLDFEFGFVEYLDIPDSPDSVYKRMVFTGFTNTAMPLIRYDVGDLCIPSEDLCSCGRSSEIVEEIVGRSEDYIVTPDGRRIQGMNQVFEWAEKTREIQFVQPDINTVVVNYVPLSDFRFERDLEGLSVELRRRLGPDMNIEFQAVNQVKKTTLGKFKAVVSMLPK
jgi:phenylacetate-CoA ligase